MSKVEQKKAGYRNLKKETCDNIIKVIKELPYNDIEIDENKTIKYYEARYTQDGYAPYETLLPVAITEVIGVTISGDNELTTAHQGKYKISFKLRGYNVDFKENNSFENAMKNPLPKKGISEQCPN